MGAKERVVETAGRVSLAVGSVALVGAYIGLIPIGVASAVIALGGGYYVGAQAIGRNS